MPGVRWCPRWRGAEGVGAGRASTSRDGKAAWLDVGPQGAAVVGPVDEVIDPEEVRQRRSVLCRIEEETRFGVPQSFQEGPEPSPKTHKEKPTNKGRRRILAHLPWPIWDPGTPNRSKSRRDKPAGFMSRKALQKV